MKVNKMLVVHEDITYLVHWFYGGCCRDERWVEIDDIFPADPSLPEPDPDILNQVADKALEMI